MPHSRCLVLVSKYSKHPRIRTYIFASQPELVLIFLVFSKKSGCLGSSLGSHFFFRDYKIINTE